MSPLERCELLTPVDGPGYVEELRAQAERGRYQHAGEELDDGTLVLVTTIVLPVTVRAFGGECPNCGHVWLEHGGGPCSRCSCPGWPADE